MITTYKEPYRDGELRIGWASWDDGTLTSRSIKYAYPDSSGKISRGSPELPFDILIDMLMLATEQGETDGLLGTGRHTSEPEPIASLSRDDLVAESKQLKSALVILQKLMMDVPWADFGAVYDRIGMRYESIKAALTKS